MKTIEEYAIELVCFGAEEIATDDLNEEGEIAEEDHQAACDLALDIAKAIRANPTAVLALVDRTAPSVSAAPTELEHLRTFVQWVARLDKFDPEPGEEMARRVITRDQIAAAAQRVLGGSV